MNQTETEVKLRLSNAQDGIRRLQTAGAQTVSDRLHESNQIWDTPGEALHSTGRMLRVRHFGPKILLTCKGPQILSDKYKSREESEVTVDDLAGLTGILSLLGYAGGFQYEKYRTEFRFPGEAGHICLDETPIGDFLELEGTGEWIDRGAKRLGFSASDYITDSYGELFRKYRLQQNLRAKDMLFRDEEKSC